MANKEVCEVFIEQQIEEGLQEGKTPYSIGKELSAWVEKLFAAKIPDNTIIRRAERIRERNTTNVVKPATPEPAKENEHIQDFKSEHGGVREGAGRPRKAQPVSDAEMIVDIIISQLDRIRADDPNRESELIRLHDYLITFMSRRR